MLGSDTVEKAKELLNGGSHFRVCPKEEISEELARGLAVNENSIFIRSLKGDVQARVDLQESGKINVAFMTPSDSQRNFTIIPGRQTNVLNIGNNAFDEKSVVAGAKSVRDHITTQLGIERNPDLKNALDFKYEEMIMARKIGGDALGDIFAREADNGQAQNLADNLEAMSYDIELIRQTLTGDEGMSMLFQKLLDRREADFSEISDEDVYKVQKALRKLSADLREGGAVALALFKLNYGINEHQDNDFQRLLERDISIREPGNPKTSPTIS